MKTFDEIKFFSDLLIHAISSTHFLCKIKYLNLAKRNLGGMLWLTYDFHLVCGVDFSSGIGHMAGVLPAVLWRQVLQTQRPPLLLTAVLFGQWAAVFQPDDVGPRIPAGSALESHRAALRPSNDTLPHLGWLGETRSHCRRTEGTRGKKVFDILEEKTSSLKCKCPVKKEGKYKVKRR